jgi:hypothetical protein
MLVMDKYEIEEALKRLRIVEMRNSDQLVFEKSTVVCPEMIFGNKMLQHPTWTVTDCKRRIRHGAPMCVSCKVMRPDYVAPPQTVLLCGCGEPAVTRSVIPAATKPVCDKCHRIRRYYYISEKYTDSYKRMNRMSKEKSAIVSNASRGHLPSRQWCQENVKGWSDE